MAIDIIRLSFSFSSNGGELGSASVVGAWVYRLFFSSARPEKAVSLRWMKDDRG